MNNKLMITLAVIADLALVGNVWHHWEPPKPIVNVDVSCASSGKLIHCGVIRQYNEEEQEAARKERT